MTCAVSRPFPALSRLPLRGEFSLKTTLLNAAACVCEMRQSLPADDTTTSDAGTFVSVDNFMTSPAPPIPHPGAAAGTADEGASIAPASSRESDETTDRASFVFPLDRRFSQQSTPQDDDDDFTDASDLCGTFDEDVGSSAPDSRLSAADVDETEDHTLLYEDGPSAATAALTTPHGFDAPFGDADTTETQSGATARADVEEKLFEAAAGLTSFQIENPFEGPSSVASRLVLVSKDGPFSNDEKSAFEVLAVDEASPASKVLSKLVETILFQRSEIANVKSSADEVAKNALYSESRRFSEVQRRRSFAMQALIEELDNERNRSTNANAEREAAQESLAKFQAQIQQVTAYCKQFNPQFSLTGDIEVALESIFSHAKESRRESARQVAEQSAQLELFASRVLKLEEFLSKSRMRSDEVERENVELKRKLSELDAQPVRVVHESPVGGSEPSPAFQTNEKQDEELREKLAEQDEQIMSLQSLLRRGQEEKKKVDEALLTMNVDLEMARNKVKTLQCQRNAAERNCREADKKLVSETDTFLAMSRELSENIVHASVQLDQKEHDLRMLQTELEDRETIAQDLQIQVGNLENQVQQITAAAVNQARNHGAGDTDSKVSSAVETVMTNLMSEVERAQCLLQERSDETSLLRKKLAEKEEDAIALHKECERARAVVAIKISSPKKAANHTYAEEQQSNFLQRLSATLGVHSDNHHEMIHKLIARVEQLTSERSSHETAMGKLRSEVLDRERTLHVVRSEMQSEVQALKADVQHLENLKSRAQRDCQFAESKLLEVLGQREVSVADSIGDLTSSSIGTRRLSTLLDEGSQSRRESLYSVAESENTLHWNDPLVAAAVRSCNNLIDLKENLASRLRALQERMDRMIRRGETKDNCGNDVRELMIESKEIQADLSGVLDMQQGIIDNLRRSSAAFSGPDADDTLPYIRGQARAEPVELERRLPDGNMTADFSSLPNNGVQVARADSEVQLSGRVGKTAAFFRDQLQQTRNLYNEKSKANAELCGVVAELRQDLDQLTVEKNRAEELLKQVSENHASYLMRLSAITQTDPSMVAIEDYLRSVVQDADNLAVKLANTGRETASLQRHVVNLIAQKRVLCGWIDTYQSKYHLNLLTPSETEIASPRRRFKIVVWSVLACRRLGKLVRESSAGIDEIDISHYDVPGLAAIGRPSGSALNIMDAYVAVSAIPKLEAAIVEREKQIEDLKSTVSALDSVVAPIPEDMRGNIQTSFAYDEDVVSRKEAITQRLRKTLREKSDIESQLSHERQVRIGAEAKVARYREKLLSAKKMLNRANAKAESKEKTYKAAIKYMKHKADKAVEQDENADENTLWNTSEGAGNHAPRDDKVSIQGTNILSIQVLEGHLARATEEISNLAVGTTEHNELDKYIRGLRNTIQRLGKPKRNVPQQPSVLDGNIVA